MACPNPISVKAKFPRKGQTHNHVPCGTCPKCLTEKRAQWTVRIKQHQKNCLNSFFLTLTYEDEKVPLNEIGIPNLNKEHLTLFSKMLKQDSKHQEKMQPTPLKKAKITYYAIGEYGEQTLRPHYHYIIFNLHPKTINRLDEIWKKGYVKVGRVETKSIHYVTNYVNKKKIWPGQEYPGTKQEKEQMFQKPFATISNGIGEQFVKNTKDSYKTLEPYMIQDGYKIKIPRYIKDKIYDKHTRENLKKAAIKKADKAYQKFDSHYLKMGMDPEKERNEQYEAFVKKFNKKSINKSL